MDVGRLSGWFRRERDTVVFESAGEIVYDGAGETSIREAVTLSR